MELHKHVDKIIKTYPQFNLQQSLKQSQQSQEEDKKTEKLFLDHNDVDGQALK